VDIQRTVTILLPEDDDLRRTLDAFRAVQQQVSEACYNNGNPLAAVPLHRAVYHRVKGSLNSQMTITALRLVAGAYASAKRKRKPATRPFLFRRAAATFLVGARGRDASFRADGSLSIWTVGGRKRLPYTVPAKFQRRLAQAKEIDCLTVVERDGRLIGRVVVTLDVPDPTGVQPVGIDLNETNALVAVDVAGRELFVSGKEVKIANRKTRKTRARLQRKHAARKAVGEDTRSIRRAFKRLGRKQRNRSRTFAQQTAKRLVDWAPPDSILVFEDLKVSPQSKANRYRSGIRRRMTEWQYGSIRRAVVNKAQERGLAVARVNPAYTSQMCACCGRLGARRKHKFVCTSCGHEAHADVNAAKNIRDKFAVLRSGGPVSVGPEVRTPPGVAGKPSGASGGH
jgi:IS605 OrfB family transposase